MGKTATTWQVLKDAWGLLMRDKELLVFPVVSGLATFLVLATFVIPFVGAAIYGAGTGPGNTVMYVVLFCYYVCNFFVVIYFNAALVVHVVTRLRGGDPTLGQSFAAFGVLFTAAVLYLVALGIVMSTLRAIFGAALYLYAKTGEAPTGFDPAVLRGAIHPA